MPKYIELEALLTFANNDKYGMIDANDIARFPTSDVAEVRHGEWKYNRHCAPDESPYYCSLCIDGGSDRGVDNYCPNCGAKMDGKRE